MSSREDDLVAEAAVEWDAWPAIDDHVDALGITVSSGDKQQATPTDQSVELEAAAAATGSGTTASPSSSEQGLMNGRRYGAGGQELSTVPVASNRRHGNPNTNTHNVSGGQSSVETRAAITAVFAAIAGVGQQSGVEQPGRKIKPPVPVVDWSKHFNGVPH